MNDVATIEALQGYRIVEMNFSKPHVFTHQYLGYLQRRTGLRNDALLIVIDIVVQQVCTHGRLESDQRQCVTSRQRVLNRFFKTVVPERPLADVQTVGQKRHRITLTQDRCFQNTCFSQPQHEVSVQLIFADIFQYSECRVSGQGKTIRRCDAEFPRQKQVGESRFLRFLAEAEITVFNAHCQYVGRTARFF